MEASDRGPELPPGPLQGRLGGHFTVWSTALLGAIGSLGAAGITFYAASLLSLIALVNPFTGIFSAVALKPLIDCFWSATTVRLLGMNLNLQSVVGLIFPTAAAVALYPMLRSLPFTRLEFVAIAYAASTTLSALLAASHSAALADLAKIILPLAFLSFGRLYGQIRGRVVILGIVLAIYGAVPLLTGVMELVGLIRHAEGAEPLPSGVYRIAGLYHHPLDIAMRCSLALPFALYLSEIGSSLKRIGFSIWALLLAAISYATLVRSALVVIAFQLVIWLWIQQHRVAALVAVISFGIAFLTIGPLQRVVREAIRPLGEGSVYELGTGRALLYVAQAAAFINATPVQKLVGRGLHSVQGTIVDYSPVQVGDLQTRNEEGHGVGSHNQYLRVLGESGLIGLVLFLALLAGSLRACLRGALAATCAGDRAFSVASLCALAGVLVYSLALTPLDYPGITWPLWLVVGCQLGTPGQIRPSAGPLA